MKGKQACGNCRFWKQHADGFRVWPDGQEYQMGACRRYPPTVIPPDESFDDAGREWPLMENSEWCGEWQAENPGTVELTVLALARQCLAGDLEAGRVLADRVMELTGGEG